ncbi:hypothetical protein LCGC14_2509150 [marine sediment metagenome]|uniref:Uncharacterized protein n=1 Tax=marine sediment metagenome TaxID=412755 RepID=A0A0F9B0B5_9ZZZZ
MFARGGAATRPKSVSASTVAALSIQLNYAERNVELSRRPCEGRQGVSPQSAPNFVDNHGMAFPDVDLPRPAVLGLHLLSGPSSPFCRRHLIPRNARAPEGAEGSSPDQSSVDHVLTGESPATARHFHDCEGAPILYYNRPERLGAPAGPVARLASRSGRRDGYPSDGCSRSSRRCPR